MAALTILEIFRLTINITEAPDAVTTDMYIPTAEGMFEAITGEVVTIAASTSGVLNWDVVIAYLAISVYYAMRKEGHMFGADEDQIPAHVWWEQSAFRHMVAIGYSEYFEYNAGRGLYVVKDKVPKALDAMGVKDLSGGYGDVI